jgi:hypothetical protein
MVEIINRVHKATGDLNKYKEDKSRKMAQVRFIKIFKLYEMPNFCVSNCGSAVKFKSLFSGRGGFIAVLLCAHK